MADLVPNKKRIAQYLRMLGASDSERRTAFVKLELAMRDAKVSWTDIGNAVEQDGGEYTESELLEYGQAARAEGVEAGIKIGLARGSNGGGNGAGTLPSPAIMAEYCHQQLGRLKNDWQRDFVTDLFVITRRTTNLSLARLANLTKIYIEFGGKV